MDLFSFTHYLVLPVVAYLLIRLFFGAFKLLTFVHFFYLAYFFLIYLGSLNVFRDSVPSVHYYISVIIVPVVFGISAAATYFIAGYPLDKRLTNLPAFKVSGFDDALAALAPAIVMYFAGVVVLYVFDKGFSSIAILFLLANPGESSAGMELRIDGLTSNWGIIFTALYSYTRALFAPLAVSLLYILALSRRVHWRYFLATVFLAVLFCSVTAAKAPIAIIFLNIALTGYLYKRKLNAAVLFLGASGLILPAFIYPLLYGTEGVEIIQVAFEGLFRRLFWVPTYATAVYFDFVDSTGIFLTGASNRIISFFTGQQYVNLPSLVYDAYFGASISGGMVNASFFASFYSDFGFPGLIFISMFAGFLLVSLQIYFDYFRRDLVGVAAKSMVAIGVMYLMLSNIYAVALGRGLLSIPLLLICLDVVKASALTASRDTGTTPVVVSEVGYETRS